jgi:hypothetical protein
MKRRTSALLATRPGRSSVLLAACVLIRIFSPAEAFAQTAPTDSAAAPTASAPPTSMASTESPTSAPLDQNNSVPTHSEKAAIPQSEERPFVRSPQMQRAMERRTTWDLNLELGYGRIFPSPPHWEGFFRGGAGILFVRDPLFWVLRFTYDYSPRSNAVIGTELEANWVETGIWGNLGLMKDANSKYWGGRASVGFAIFGFEAEYRGDDTTKTYFALYGKLRFPLGVIAQVLR